MGSEHRTHRVLEDVPESGLEAIFWRLHDEAYSDHSGPDYDGYSGDWDTLSHFYVDDHAPFATEEEAEDYLGSEVRKGYAAAVRLQVGWLFYGVCSC